MMSGVKRHCGGLLELARIAAMADPDGVVLWQDLILETPTYSAGETGARPRTWRRTRDASHSRIADGCIVPVQMRLATVYGKTWQMPPQVTLGRVSGSL
jgi:hypothetical protein